ncbi:hypothetical protein EZV61_17225 [Corallincola luteus]|uniref:Cache domain-containing protein n=2 Tax=Corallincola luteus TaxID=1775177 RepID=A0ABY2AGQ1_9GAMM|nr:hypothetical protein EZV61_17225 [Corallincola luteus]
MGWSSNMVRKLSLRLWLITALILALLFISSGIFITHLLTNRQLDESAQRLQLINSLRKQALLTYFETASTELTFWSLNPKLVSKQAELNALWDNYAATQGDPGARLREVYVEKNPHPKGQYRELVDTGIKNSRYNEIHVELHPMARRFVTERGYYDALLITPNGNTLYSVEKEADFGAALLDDSWRDTLLSTTFQRAMATPGKVIISDIAHYQPSGDAPTIFIARTMSNKNDQVLGVLVFQLPTDELRQIMHFKAGMGESGETYLVGQDYLMRSDSRFESSSTVLQKQVETPAIENALAGNAGVMHIPDYRGIPVLSAYDYIDFDTFRWAIVAEIDRAEALNKVSGIHASLAGLMALFYVLALGSVWLIRGDDIESQEALSLMLDTDNNEPEQPI